MFDGKTVCKEVIITQNNWADFVFDDDYELMSLEEVKAFIEENNHLPDVPSEQEIIESGVNSGQMDATLLQKIEELTLYVIELKEENERIKAQLEGLN